jgi:hypothetical protein
MSMIFSILEKFKRTIGWPLGIEVIPYSLPSRYRFGNGGAMTKILPQAIRFPGWLLTPVRDSYFSSYYFPIF